MYKTYKFRIYPNKKQTELLNKIFGCQRFVYNHYLNKIKTKGYTTVYSNSKDYDNNLKYEYTFLQEIDTDIIKKTIFQLDTNLKKYYNHKFSYPKYKSKYAKQSYTISNKSNTYNITKYNNIVLDLNIRKIKLPNLEWVKIRGYSNLKHINGKLINATISHDINGKYYVSVLYNTIELKNKKNIPKSIVGIDLGIKKLLTLSDGITYDNNKYIEKYEKRIKRLQRELSRKQKNSKNYYKCKKKLSILYGKLKNARKCYLHEITKKITDEYDIIVCETLKTKDMLMKKVFSKSISDASLSEIIRQLEYKCKYKQKLFYQIDTYYPSSQECSVCGSIDKTYKDLNKRVYKCNNCHHIQDRDLNASLNIAFEGLKLYMKEKFTT